MGRLQQALSTSGQEAARLGRRATWLTAVGVLLSVIMALAAAIQIAQATGWLHRP